MQRARMMVTLFKQKRKRAGARELLHSHHTGLLHYSYYVVALVDITFAQMVAGLVLLRVVICPNIKCWDHKNPHQREGTWES